MLRLRLLPLHCWGLRLRLDYWGGGCCYMKMVNIIIMLCLTQILFGVTWVFLKIQHHIFTLSGDVRKKRVQTFYRRQNKAPDFPKSSCVLDFAPRDSTCNSQSDSRKFIKSQLESSNQWLYLVSRGAKLSTPSDQQGP